MHMHRWHTHVMRKAHERLRACSVEKKVIWSCAETIDLACTNAQLSRLHHAAMHPRQGGVDVSHEQQKQKKQKRATPWQYTQQSDSVKAWNAQDRMHRIARLAEEERAEEEKARGR